MNQFMGGACTMSLRHGVFCLVYSSADTKCQVFATRRACHIAPRFTDVTDRQLLWHLVQARNPNGLTKTIKTRGRQDVLRTNGFCIRLLTVDRSGNSSMSGQPGQNLPVGIVQNPVIKNMNQRLATPGFQYRIFQLSICILYTVKI